MNFYDRIIDLMHEQNLRQIDITRDLGFKPGHFQTWRKGSTPRPEALKKLANYFNVSESYLLGFTDEKMQDSSIQDTQTVSAYDMGKTRMIPLFSGIPECENIFEETKYIDDYVPCSNNLRTMNNLFAIVATSDTMTPIIDVGDIIIAQFAAPCECDDLCVYRMYGAVGVRWLSMNDTDITLESECLFNEQTNKGYKTITIPKEKTSDYDFEFIGKVVEVRKILRNLHHIRK